MSLARGQGAHDVLNHRDADYLSAVMPLTGGRGVDLVLEMLANVNLDRDLEILAPRGRVMVVGNRGRIEIDPRKIMSKDGAVLGMLMMNATDDEYRVIHAALAPGLAGGWFTPVVGRELPLAEAAEAHRAVMEPGAYGKIVLLP
jgi:NADPH2:quinone reductase